MDKFLLDQGAVVDVEVPSRIQIASPSCKGVNVVSEKYSNSVQAGRQKSHRDFMTDWSEDSMYKEKKVDDNCTGNWFV